MPFSLSNETNRSVNEFDTISLIEIAKVLQLNEEQTGYTNNEYFIMIFDNLSEDGKSSYSMSGNVEDVFFGENLVKEPAPIHEVLQKILPIQLVSDQDQSGSGDLPPPPPPRNKHLLVESKRKLLLDYAKQMMKLQHYGNDNLNEFKMRLREFNQKDQKENDELSLELMRIQQHRIALEILHEQMKPLDDEFCSS